MKKYFYDYKFNSIFWKNMLRLLLLAVVPLMIMVIISYLSYSSMQEQEIETENERIIGAYQRDWERILGESKAELNYIAFSKNVELFMYDTQELAELYYSLSSIQDMISMPVVSKKYIDNVYVYSEKSDMVISKEGTAEYEKSRGRVYIEAYRKQGEKKRVLQVMDDDYGYARPYIAVYQEVNYGPRFHGITVITLDIKALARAFMQAENEAIYLTDGEWILYSNMSDTIGTHIQDIPQYETAETGKSIIKEMESIGYRSLEDFDLEVLLVKKIGDYREQLKGMRNVMMQLIMLTSLFVIGMSFWLSVRMYQPIREIIDSLKQNQNVLIGEKEFLENNELDYILKTIAQSAIRKKNVDEALKERIELLKKAKSVALQSQINPHFLNNTLDTINWTAIEWLGKKNAVSEITQALSGMLRMALENTDAIIPFCDEIEHCNHYLFIQTHRYEGVFDVSWDIPEEVYRYGTIRIVLQPIVENAIYHGVKLLSGGGHIHIKARVLENMIEMDVKDNGLGMSEENLIRLQAKLQEDMLHESKHIGLVNVNQRLKLYFGEMYGLVIKSTEGLGTTVKIRIPKIPIDS